MRSSLSAFLASHGASRGIVLHSRVRSRKTAPMLSAAQGLIVNGMVPS